MNRSTKILTPARIMCIFATILLTIASIMSFNHTPSHISIFPKPEITIFSINLLSALIAFFLILKPENHKLQSLILLIQSISTTVTGYEVLGTFLFTACLIILFINGFFKEKSRIKIIVLLFIWFLVLIAFSRFQIINHPNDRRCLYNIILECGVSLFFIGFYFYVYKKLEELLSPLMPATKERLTELKMPGPGSELILTNYGLTERQAKIVKEFISTKKTYGELGKDFFLSTSSIKKEMSKVFTIFGVQNLTDLTLLLSQYILKI